MKVLIATHLTQGERADDYFAGVDGELVTPVTVECCQPDTCGCSRGFAGLASHRATTTALVADLPHLDTAALRVAVRDSLAAQGWLGPLDATEAAQLVTEHVWAITESCRSRTVGTIVRRHHQTIWFSDARAA